MQKVELSIVIVNLENKKLTLDCLNSIKENTKDLDYEVILVDNGSKDDSVGSFKKIQKEDFWKKRLQIIVNKTNTGYAKANNQGIKRASGNYVLLLNNDTLVHENALTNLIDFAKKTSDAGVVGSRLLNLDGSLQDSCFNFPTAINAFKEYFLNQKGLFGKYSPRGENAVSVDALVGAVFLITPKARELVGFLNEKYFAYFEDIDYCREVKRKGFKVYYLPSSLVTHYHGATFKKLAGKGDQWKKLIPSSKVYHGLFNHYFINAIIWTGQKWQKFLKILK